MSSNAFSPARLQRMHEIMADHVERGALPGLVTLVNRRGETHVDAIGTQALGGSVPMRRNTLFRIASMTKPILAAAAMILVEECRLRLDDPVDDLLPELAGRRVLRRIDGPLTDTVPARRPISLRDLLTLRLGIGAVMAPPDTYPVQTAMAEAGLAPSASPSPLTSDEWLRRLGELPLIHAPGEGWMYHTGFEVLGILLARATGQPLGTFLQQRLFGPLGMPDTHFGCPADKRHRLPPTYGADPQTGALAAEDTPDDDAPGGTEVISTIDDYLAFCQLLLGGGRVGNERLLSRASVTLMTTDQLTPTQKAENKIFFGSNRGWGFGLAVYTHRDALWATPGRFGWDGGVGTSAYTDPQEDLIGILMTQRLMDSPVPPAHFVDFWTAAYAALDS